MVWILCHLTGKCHYVGTCVNIRVLTFLPGSGSLVFSTISRWAGPEPKLALGVLFKIQGRTNGHCSKIPHRRCNSRSVDEFHSNAAIARRSQGLDSSRPSVPAVSGPPDGSRARDSA